MGYSSGPSDRGPGKSSNSKSSNNKSSGGGAASRNKTYGPGPVNRSPHKDHNKQKNNKDNYKRSGGDSTTPKPKIKLKVPGNPYHKPAPNKNYLHDLNAMAFDAFNKYPDHWGREDGQEKAGDITQSIVNGNVSHRWRQEGMDYNMSQTMNPVSYGPNTDLAREFRRRAPPGGGGANSGATSRAQNRRAKGPIKVRGMAKAGGMMTDGIFGIAGKVIGGALGGPIGGWIGGKVASKIAGKARTTGSGTPMRSSGPGDAPAARVGNQNFAQSGYGGNYGNYEPSVLPTTEGPIKKNDAKKKYDYTNLPRKLF